MRVISVIIRTVRVIFRLFVLLSGLLGLDSPDGEQPAACRN
jgi:hypothetical protein